MARKSAMPVNLHTHFSDFLLRRARDDAMRRAHRLAQLDPQWKSQPITVREDELMRLALRCMIDAYPAEQEIWRRELHDRTAPAPRVPTP